MKITVIAGLPAKWNVNVKTRQKCIFMQISGNAHGMQEE
jgi:hypothetical protein